MFAIIKAAKLRNLARSTVIHSLILFYTFIVTAINVMEEPVVSNFAAFYYAKVIGTVIAFIGIVCGLTYNPIINKESGNGSICILLLCLAALVVCFYNLLKTCIGLNITSERVLVTHYLTNKQVNIQYDDIKSLSTYRRKSYDGRSGQVALNPQTFDIDLKNGKTIRFTSGDYTNYDSIKAALYKYKQGIGL